MPTHTHATTQILALFRQHGQLEYGEQVTQLSHAVQAGCFARDWGYDDELVLAAFLHDIGHLAPLAQAEQPYATMGHLGMEAHDHWGESYLNGHGFSPRLVATVRNHVAAKRYLCRLDPAYYEELSDASRQTLVYQGGPMTAPEAAAFEADPFFEDSIRIRRVDEAAKIADFTVTDAHWAYFEALLEQVLGNRKIIT